MDKATIEHHDIDVAEKAPANMVENDEIAAEKTLQDTRHADLGAAWLAEYNGPRPEITDAESTRVRWKVDTYLLPIICYIYFTQQLDKSSLSFASVFNIQKDTHMVGQDYAWCSSIVYFAQLFFQPLSVYALVVFPVNYWISACFLGWGSSLMISAAMRNFAGIAAMRFILGAFEASIAPSMVVVVAMWWTRREQPLRNNIWYSTNGIATIVGSIMSYGLGHAAEHSKLFPYQLIFLVCGAIAVVLAIPTFFIFPRHPTRARWLSEDEKYIALERIRLNNTGTQSHDFKWSQVRECVTDPKQWMFAAMIFCVSLVSGGIGAFGPLILKGFGLSSFQTILYNMIPGAIQIATNLISAFAIMRFKQKSGTLFVLSLVPLAAAAAFKTIHHTKANRHKLLAVYFILQTFSAITPITFSWAFANTAGHTKKTTTTGMLYLGLTVGNIVGPQLYRKDQAPEYTTGLTANLVVLCILTCLIVLMAVYLSYLNKKNVTRRRELGRTGEVVDLSLESSSNWDKLRAKQQQADQEENHDHERHNAQAFFDLTDRANPDFIYNI